jgi:multidrug efflux pump subunit AcrB
VIDATYTPLLHRALARPRATLVGAALLFVGSMALVPLIGFSLFPKAGIPQFRVTVRMADDATIAQTDSATRFVERTLLARPSVRHVLSNVGHGNPFVYYNVPPEAERPNFAEVFARVDRFDPRHTTQMLDTLRTIFDGYPDGRISVLEYENGPPLEAPIAIRFIGPELDSLRLLANRFDRLLSSIEGTRDVENPLGTSRTTLRVAIDRARAGLLGVPVVEIDKVVRLGLAGLPAGRIQDRDGEAYDVTARLARAGEFQFEHASRRDAHSEDRAGRPWACALLSTSLFVHIVIAWSCEKYPSSHHDVPAHASLIHALLAADFRRRVSSLGSPRPRL